MAEEGEEREKKGVGMKRETLEKLGVAYVLVSLWALGVKIGYGGDSVATYGTDEVLVEHVLWIFCHANVWHLLGNLFVLFIMRGRLYLLPSLLIAFAASWIPSVPGVWDIVATESQHTVTMGFSGVLFAIIGVKWGVVCRDHVETYLSFCKKILPFALMGFFIPHINWSIHTYCLLMGLAYGVVRPTSPILK